MYNYLSGVIVICILINTPLANLSENDDSVTDPQNTQISSREETREQVLTSSALEHDQDASDNQQLAEGRSISDNVEKMKSKQKNSKPLRSIFMGIYKNYKSTYLGNKTLTEYKQTLRETMKNKQHQQQKIESEETEEGDEEEDNEELLQMVDDDDEEEGAVTVQTADDEPLFMSTTSKGSLTEGEFSTQLPNNNRKRKHNDSTPKAHPPYQPTDKPSPHINSTTPAEEHYTVGPALNMSLDLQQGIVKVNLDGESLKDLVAGHWLNDNSEEGRGKKYEMVTRILPLFILPFLIQSAIVPFLVTKLKLLLMKSMLVGKLAIFLLIISAFRNSNKAMQTYEVAPSYWASEPSRRSEMAAAASNMAYNGYRVEGKPTAWIN